MSLPQTLGEAHWRIHLLEQELKETRQTLVQMAKARIYRAMRRDNNPDLFELSAFTQPDTVNKLIAWAATFTEEGDTHAPCPLCDSGPRVYLRHGFVMPGGLRLHLTGGKKARLCPVIAAAHHERR